MQTGSLKKKKRVEKQAAVPPTPERSMFPLQSVNQSVSQSVNQSHIDLCHGDNQTYRYGC